jgi:hypothetical protein
MAQQGGLVERLIQLLVDESGKIQAHAATALGRASVTTWQGKKAARKRIKSAIKTDEADELAVLTGSKDKDLAEHAADLLKLIDAKDISKMRDKGLERMFGRPKGGKSVQFRKHEDAGWRVPSDEHTKCEGDKLVKLLVFVEENGEGNIMSFHKSKFGASEHQIEFTAKGPLKVKLRRKGNEGLPWLVPPDEASVRLPWQINGGQAMTMKRYTQGASVNDVCMWLYNEKGVCCHYAGLFDFVYTAWLLKYTKEYDASKEEPQTAGTMLVEMTDETLLTKMHVTVKSHREELLRKVAGLAGFLGRYILIAGRSVHTSATCVLILAEDRKQVNEDGTLKRVAIKCMKNKEQFLTEVVMRKGLDEQKEIGRAHV